LDIDTARRVMRATAIEILLVCPLRMRNLAALRLDLAGRAGGRAALQAKPFVVSAQLVRLVL